MQVSFNLFSPTGNPHQITASGGTPDELLANYATLTALMEGKGFSDDPPNPKTLPVRNRIIGYVLGEANTKDKGKLQKCVFLYNDITQFTYKAVTVYEPQIPELPLGDVEQQKMYEGDPGMAPTRENAVKRGLMYPCDFIVLLKPVIDYSTGEPKIAVNPKGGEYTPKKYLRVAKVNKYPYRSFSGPDEAITLGVQSRVFSTTDQVKSEYEALKEKTKPSSADVMWRTWINYVNSKLESNDQE